jgi:hypothetical protein
LDVGVTPGGEGRGDVIWATWDYVRDRWVYFSSVFFVITNLRLLFHSHDESRHIRLLFIGCASAFEICTDLESLREVLNISTDRNPLV